MKWIDELVYVRGLAILSVVMIHVTMYAVIVKVQSPMYFFGYFLDDFTHYAVPVFILVSGLSLAFAYRTRLQLVPFYKKRVLTVIPTFIFFTLLYAWLFPSGVTWLRRFVFGEGTVHLYFIPLIIKLYLIFPILLWVSKKITRLGIALSLLMLVQIILSLRVQLINVIRADVLATYPTWNMLVNDPFWLYVATFFIGVIIGVHFERVYDYLRDLKDFKAVLLFAPLIPLFATIDYFAHKFNPFLIPVLKELYNVFAFVLLFKISSYITQRPGNISGIVKNIGEHSFSIYLLHMIFVNYLVEALQYGAVKDTNVLFYIVPFVLSIYASYTISYFVNLSPLPVFFKRLLTGNVVRSDEKEIKNHPYRQAPPSPAHSTMPPNAS